MAHSYQEVASKLRSLEDKIDFVMKSFTIQKKEPSFLAPGTFTVTSMTLAQLYRELTSLGEEVIEELTADPSSTAQAAICGVQGVTQADPLPASTEAL